MQKEHAAQAENVHVKAIVVLRTAVNVLPAKVASSVTVRRNNL